MGHMSPAKNSDTFLSLSLAAEWKSALYKTLKWPWWHIHLPIIFTATKTKHLLLLLPSKQSKSETNKQGVVLASSEVWLGCVSETLISSVM